MTLKFATLGLDEKDFCLLIYTIFKINAIFRADLVFGFAEEDFVAF